MLVKGGFVKPLRKISDMEPAAQDTYRRIPKAPAEVSALDSSQGDDANDPEAEILSAFMRVRQHEEDELEGLEPVEDDEAADAEVVMENNEDNEEEGDGTAAIDLLDVIRDQQVGSVYLDDSLTDFNFDWQCSAIEGIPSRSRERVQKLSSLVPPHGLRHGHVFACTAFICVTSSALTLLLGWHPTAFVIVMCWLMAAAAFLWFYCRSLIILAMSWCEGNASQDEDAVMEVATVDELHIRDWPAFVATDASESEDSKPPSEEEVAEINAAVEDFITRAQAQKVEVSEVEHPVDLDELYPNRPKPRNVNILVAPDDNTFIKTKRAADVCGAMRAARPYVEINMFGIWPAVALLDTGSNLSVIDVFTYAEIRDCLAKDDFCPAEICSTQVLRSFNGAKLSSVGAVLANVMIGKAKVFNLPFVVVKPDSKAKRILIIGMNLIEHLKIDLVWGRDGPEECMQLNFGSNPSWNGVKASMRKTTPHSVHLVKPATVMPGAVSAVYLDFDACASVECDLDDTPLFFELKREYAEQADVFTIEAEQIVERLKDEKGDRVMKALIRNTGGVPIHLYEDQSFATVRTMYNEEGSLSPIHDYVSAVEDMIPSTQNIRHCLCDHTLEGAVLFVPVHRSGFTGLGVRLEMNKPWDKTKKSLKSDNLECRTPHIFYKANNNGTRETLTQHDLDTFKMSAPEGHKVIIPYFRPSDIDDGVIQAAKQLSNLGYSVELVAFMPLYDKDGSQPDAKGDKTDEPRCLNCKQASVEASLKLEDSYKISTVVVVVPTNEGEFPSDFDNKIEGSQIYTFQVFDMTWSYYYCDRNTMIFVPHIPRSLYDWESRAGDYMDMSMAYLKCSFPFATIKLTCVSTANTSSMLIDKVREAYDKSYGWPDYAVAEFKPNRHLDVTKHTYEKASREVDNCACVLCTKGKLGANHEVVFEGMWPLLDLGKDDPENAPRVFPVRNAMRRLFKVNEFERASNASSTGSDIDGPPYERSSRQSVLTLGDCDASSFINMNEFVPNKTGSVDSELDGPADVLEWHTRDPMLTPVTGNTPFTREDIPKLCDLSHLLNDQRELVMDVMYEHPKLWAVNTYDHRVLRGHTIDFQVKDPLMSFYMTPFPMSGPELAALKEHLTAMERKGFIIRSECLRVETRCFSNSFCVFRNSNAKHDHANTGKEKTDCSLRVVFNLGRNSMKHDCSQCDTVRNL